MCYLFTCIILKRFYVLNSWTHYILYLIIFGAFFFWDLRIKFVTQVIKRKNFIIFLCTKITPGLSSYWSPFIVIFPNFHLFNCMHLIVYLRNMSWLVWFSGLSVILWTRSLLVQFPVMVPAWVAGLVPSRWRRRGNHTSIFLFFSLPSRLSKNKYI